MFQRVFQAASSVTRPTVAARTCMSAIVIAANWFALCNCHFLLMIHSFTHSHLERLIAC